jgi:hypothetical protein
MTTSQCIEKPVLRAKKMRQLSVRPKDIYLSCLDYQEIPLNIASGKDEIC